MNEWYLKKRFLQVTTWDFMNESNFWGKKSVAETAEKRGVFYFPDDWHLT